MLTDWDTYKTEEGKWNDLRAKVLHLSEASILLPDPNASFQKSALLDGKYFCDVCVYDQTQRISVLYVGIQKDQGKILLESRLGLILESRPDFERIFTPEQILLVERADERRTPSPPTI